MNFTATVATDEVDLDGECFENLEQLAEDAVGKPLYFNFGGDQIGVIDQAWVEDGAVAISGHLTELLQSPVALYVVPAGVLHSSRQEGDVKILDDYSITSLALTATPADPNLEPMKEV